MNSFRIGIFAFISLLLLGHVGQISAQINPNPQGSFEVEIGGTVSSQSAIPSPSNQFTAPTVLVNISGFASPNASIIFLDSSGTSLATLTADAEGNFTISNVNIPVAGGEFCFRVVDFRRLGNSESCITIDPAIKTTFTDVYLPPTIGVERAEISEGEEAVIYGYTMPNATVKLRLSTGDLVSITADGAGYYDYRNNALAAGDYSFVASASYNSKDSLDPKNSAFLKKLSPEEVAQKAKETIQQIGDGGGFPWWILALSLIALLTGVLFWIFKKRPELIHKVAPFLVPFMHKIFPKKGLHHDKLLKQLEKESQV